MMEKSEKNTWKNLKESEKGNTSKSTILRKDTYQKIISEKLDKILIKDKNPEKIVKNMKDILNNPYHSYKFLKHDLRGGQRVHIGHFVLLFFIDHNAKTIYFDDYEHHDKIYK